MANSTTAPRAMRQWALKGAATRLGELAAERTAIYREFPQLRGRGAVPVGNSQPAPSGASNSKPPRRSRRAMSAAQRQAVSERMRRYWAALRAGRSP
jgi:hypothetical protein